MIADPMKNLIAAADYTQKVYGTSDETPRREHATPFQAAALVSGILRAQHVEIENIDNDPAAWPTVDRIERRKIDELDPLARDIQRRLDPDGDLDWDAPVYMTTTFITGGYSEHTQEQEYEFQLECGPYIVTARGADQFDLDSLIRWIDGHDVSFVNITIKGDDE